jgi:prevent-host-death family protein
LILKQNDHNNGQNKFTMEIIPITEAKAHLLQLAARVAETGEEVILTKHGRGFVRIVPMQSTKKGWNLGEFSNEFEIVGDVVAPLDEDWDASK